MIFSGFTFVKIYGLADPRTGEIRYIGKTKHLLSTRLSQHISEAKKCHRTHRHHWINLLLKDGIKPLILLLEEVAESCWEEAERRHIAECRAQGMKLTNETDGGESPVGRKLSPWHIERIRAANLGNKHCLGYKHSQETRVRMSLSMTGKKRTKPFPQVSEETRLKLSIAGMGRRLSEDAKQKIRASKLGKPRSEETKQKLRVANLGKKASEETRLKMRLAHAA